MTFKQFYRACCEKAVYDMPDWFRYDLPDWLETKGIPRSLQQAFDYSYVQADPYQPITIRLFKTIEAYNAAEVRHPIPDLSDAQAALKSYIGDEPATELPINLTDADARAWTKAVAKMHDYWNEAELVSGTAVRTIYKASSAYDSQTPQRDVHRFLWHKTLANLSVTRSYFIEYCAYKLYTPGEDRTEFLKQLDEIGITPDPIASGGHPILPFRPLFISYERKDGVSFATLIDNAQEQFDVNFLEFLMARCNGGKPQYTQPQLFLVQDAIKRSAALLPECKDDFDILQRQYEETGLAAAVSTMRKRAQDYKAYAPHRWIRPHVDYE